MAKDVITLVLKGDVPFDLFTRILEDFNALIHALPEEIVGPDQIEWQVVTEFGTATSTTSLKKPVVEAGGGGGNASLGRITGVVSALWVDPLGLAIRDATSGATVRCYLSKDQEESARLVWGRRVAVIGSISRDADTGQPVAVRDVKSLTLEDEGAPQGYKQARGVLPWQAGDEPAEVTIRRNRDAG